MNCCTPLVITNVTINRYYYYDFLFPSCARFREGTRPMPQKVFPHPTVRAPSASNSPSALSAGWIINKENEEEGKIMGKWGRRENEDFCAKWGAFQHFGPYEDQVLNWRPFRSHWITLVYNEMEMMMMKTRLGRYPMSPTTKVSQWSQL